jgi:sugar lactone lactonase YvrE
MVTTASLWFAPSREINRFLPEGPRLLPSGDFIWVNIQKRPDARDGLVYLRSRATRQVRILPVPGRPGFVFPTDNPALVLVGCEKCVGLLDLDTLAWHPLATIPDADPRTIINDGEIVPGGKAIVFGTKDTRFADAIAHLYLHTADGNQLSVLAGGMTCSNGKVFADGGRTLYDIDTPRKVVTEYELDVEKRTLTEKGIALDLRHRPDSPDGMCDAGDGTVIVAFYNPEYADAGRAVRFRLHTGEVLDEWLTPGSPRVTCPLLFEDEGKVKLLLTTADEGMAPELRAKCPNAGCLFVADTALSAVPAAEVVRV